MLYQGSVGQWDAVEGAQNFADYSDHGDHLAQDAEEASARQDTKWGVIGALAAESVAMCRTVSRSSAGSFKVRPSKISSSSSSSNSRRLRIQSQSQTQTQTQTQTQIQTCLPATSYVTALPANTAHLYGLSNAANYFYYSSNSAIASAMNGMNPDQYLAMCSQTISPVTSYSTSPYTTDQATGFGQHSQAQQHVNPACTQMTMDGFDHFDGLESLSGIEESLDGLDGISGLSGGYEPSVAAISPQSWGSSSSRRSSPDRGEDTWSLPLTSSPAESHGSPASSPLAIEAAVSSSSSSSNSSKSNSSNNNSNNNNNNNNNNTNSSSSSSSSDGSNVSSGSNNNDTATAVAMQQKRSNSEGESARDHPLYKKAVCQPDGYYHCPWEGDENCNHKPEKLKCNYEYVYYCLILIFPLLFISFPFHRILTLAANSSTRTSSPTAASTAPARARAFRRRPASCATSARPMPCTATATSPTSALRLAATAPTLALASRASGTSRTTCAACTTPTASSWSAWLPPLPPLPLPPSLRRWPSAAARP